MINSYSEVVGYTGYDFIDYLNQINLYIIFEGLFTEYDDLELSKKIVRYIAYSHSIGSGKITIGGDRRKELHTIFKELQIEDKYYDDVVLLEKEAVRKSADKWLKHQDSRQIEYLFTLQNAYVQHQAASLKDLRTATGEINYDMKYKCITYMTELKKMIKDAESELQQNNELLKEAYKEVNQKNKKNTIGVENYAK